ncbi:uncharacterized protein LOC141633350 [Silene latifolia]|uniref:uncharacterized protein LOC141633350 n=1 Tax=Silene latifolia TaxID=37657 RepID=UPI003D770FDD
MWLVASGRRLRRLVGERMYTNGKTPLHKAAENGSNEAVELLLSRGAFVNAKAKNGATPLHLAVWHSLKSEDCVTVKTLLEHEADSHAKDYYGETPLHMVARNGCNEAAKLLLSRGAHVDAKAKEKTS